MTHDRQTGRQALAAALAPLIGATVTNETIGEASGAYASVTLEVDGVALYIRYEDSHKETPTRFRVIGDLAPSIRNHPLMSGAARYTFGDITAAVARDPSAIAGQVKRDILANAAPLVNTARAELKKRQDMAAALGKVIAKYRKSCPWLDITEPKAGDYYEANFYTKGAQGRINCDGGVYLDRSSTFTGKRAAALLSLFKPEA